MGNCSWQARRPPSKPFGTNSDLGKQRALGQPAGLPVRGERAAQVPLPWAHFPCRV